MFYCSGIVEYEVREKRNLPMWMQGGLNYIMLQHLNIDGVRMIGSVLGQSVALDYYVPQVDGLLAEFKDINRGLVKTGTFTPGRMLKLCKLLRDVDQNLANVDNNLLLFKRSEIAWEEDVKNSQMWEYLQDKFELTQRFAGLNFMLRLGELNIDFIATDIRNRFDLKHGEVKLILPHGVLHYC
ncbi:Protein of unknown function DUF155 [Macleaya cordata]|uniref:DUF155 domain-containing protein n=1 Tax=Macleaya cordata TaxID=56857 RepID=A0A200PY10_MACCD|nr:Protein of unknown function DUF155 [Macleaya cordata]